MSEDNLSLTQPLDVTIYHGHTEVVFWYPSFSDLLEPIANLMAGRTHITKSGNAEDRGGIQRMRFFQDHCTDTNGLKVENPNAGAQGDGEEGKPPPPPEPDVLPITNATPNWKRLIPPNLQAASAMPFDELGTAELEESDVIGRPVRVTVDAHFRDLVCEFPPYTDEEFTTALQKFVSASRVRQRGRQWNFTGHIVNARFFRRWCRRIHGVDIDYDVQLEPAQGSREPRDWRHQIPLNWAVSAVRPFAQQETLSQDEAGN